jgi:hypothetical protein
MSQKFLSDVVLTTISSGILKVDSDGKIVKAVEGTDYVSSVSAGNLDSLTDVVITSPSADQILVYGQPVGGTPGVNIWYNKTPNYLTPASSINALGDVSINSVAVGNLLSWNGSNWVNWAPNFLTSYTETDPIYTASSWYTTTNNASNWDTAYGWGNHAGLYANLIHTHSVFTQATSGIVNGEEVIVAGENGFVPASGFDDGGKFLRGDGTWQVVTTDLTGYATETWVGQQGYLTSYTETDPVFAASDVYSVRTADITNWNTAFGWGDHSEAGYLTTYTETDPIYTASSWYTTTNNASNWDTAYGWGNHSGLYIGRVLNHTQGSHSYAYPDPEAWYKIAKVVLNGNCQSMNLFGEYRDLSYYLNTAYKIHITARAECDFLSNNESHTLRVNIVTTSTNKTGFGDKVRVVLTRQEDGVREYELQYYRTTWDGGRWELQEGGGWTLYDTSQTAGTEIPSEHIVYNSNVVASNFYGEDAILSNGVTIGGNGIFFNGGTGANSIRSVAGGYLHFFGYSNVYFDDHIIARGGISNDGGDVTVNDNLLVNGVLKTTGSLLFDDLTSNAIQHKAGNDINTLVTVGHGGFDHNGYLRISGADVATQSWVAAQGYITSETDSQTLEWNQGEKLLTISNGNTVDLSQMASVQDVEAYGFITGESDTLHTVTNRGSLTSNTISVEQTTGGGFVYRTDTNWGDWDRNGFSFANGSGTVFKSLGAYGVNGNSLSYMYIGTNYTSHSIRFGSDYTYFPGLDLAISNSNNSHGTGTYFRGNSTHFVLGLINGNTLYLNYGNDGGLIHSYGTHYHHNNYIIDGNGYGITLTGGNNRIYFDNNNVQRRALEGNSDQLQIGEGYNYTLLQANYSTVATVNTYGFGIGQYAASNEKLAVNAAEGIWALSAYKSGVQIGGLHVNDAIFNVQGSGGTEVRLSTTGNATWNGDILATRTWVAAQGYLTSETDSQELTWNQGEKTLSITNGNSVDFAQMASIADVEAYGFITGESDTLATVTGRGANTSTQVGLNAGWTVPDGITNYGSHFQTNDYTTMNFFSRAWQSVQGTNGLAYNFTTHSNNGGGGYGALQIYYGESGYVYAPTSFRAPSFHGESIKIGVAGSVPTVDYGIFHQSGVGLGIVSGAGGSDQGISFWSHNGSSYFESVRIAGSTGYVGIGTASPGAKLDIVSDSSQLSIRRSDTNGATWSFYSWNGGLNIFPNEALPIYIGRDGSTTDLSLYNGKLLFGSSNALDGNNDSWLRLNNSGHYTSGVYTPGILRNDGQFINYGGIYGYANIQARKAQTNGDYTTAALWTESYNGTTTGIAFHISGNVGKFLEMRTDGILYWNSDKVWHSGNDGSGSGLDADTVDGLQASVFATRQDGTRYSTDFNTILASGFYNAEGTPPNAPGHYGQLIVAKGIDTALQIYGGYSNDELWFRGWGYGPEADGFYPWRKVWHDGNFNPTSYLPLTGSTMSGSINMNGNNITNIGQVNAAHAIFTNDASSRVMYLRGTGNIIQFQDAAAANKWEVVGRQDEFYIYKNDGTGSGMKYYINSSGNHTITGDLSVSGGFSASGYNKSNWDTAYGWGNHATANYWVTSNTDPQIVAASSVTFQYDVEIQGQLLETSSIRVKENIVDLEPVGDKVSKLRPVRYNKIGTDVQEIGLIAEEVAELFPEVVHYNEEGEAESLNYTRLSVLLLQTVKELSDRIQKLENK